MTVLHCLLDEGGEELQIHLQPMMGSVVTSQTEVPQRQTSRVVGAWACQAFVSKDPMVKWDGGQWMTESLERIEKLVQQCVVVEGPQESYWVYSVFVALQMCFLYLGFEEV